MRVDVLTLFPEMITNYCDQSILAIAQEKKLLDVYAHNPRDFSKNKHRKVDATPYGGGAGMLLSVEPFYDCFSFVQKEIQKENGDSSLAQLNLNSAIQHAENRDYEVIITCPGGQTFNQELAQKLSLKKNLVLLCGRYEGFDQRIRNLASLEISLGDYILTGGELAALTIIDSTVRLQDGVLGDSESSLFESHGAYNYEQLFKELSVTKRERLEFFTKISELSDGRIKTMQDLCQSRLLEYPQYTRPKEFNNEIVPAVLESGNHKQIFLWRLEKAIELTLEKRPDLIYTAQQQ